MNLRVAAAGLDPEHVAITEPVRGSDLPVHLMYIEMIDGVYCSDRPAQAGRAAGPFPLVMFACRQWRWRHGRSCAISHAEP